MRRVKGFTLVELIVVIAIIGILAAILIPSMMGYVTNAKFSGANAAAKSLLNGGMVACRENDVIKPIKSGVYTSADDGFNPAGNTEPYTDPNICSHLYEYMEDAQSMKWAILIQDDVAVAACGAKAFDDPYVGTYPQPNHTKMPLNSTAGFSAALHYAQTGSWTTTGT